jgi:predicted nucleic acid-binding protein
VSPAAPEPTARAATALEPTARAATATEPSTRAAAAEPSARAAAAEPATRANAAAIATAEPDPADRHRRYLVEAMARVRAMIERHAESPAAGAPLPAPLPQAAPGPPPALLKLATLFDLSDFECDVLVLCAAMELDASFPGLCARAQVDPQRYYPTFSLALAAIPGAHWEALSPSSNLRYWRLLELGPGSGLTERPLRVDERILHYLVGAECREERLAGLIEPVIGAGSAEADEPAVPSHQALAERIAATWARTVGTAELPGEEVAGKRAIAAAACRLLDLELAALRADALPTGAAELADLARLWEREGALTGSALLVDCDDVEPSDGARESALQRFVEVLHGCVFLAGRQRRRPRRRPLLTFEVAKPTPREQREVWRQALGPAAAAALAGKLDTLVAQFNLSAPTIHAVHAGALGVLGDAAADLADAAAAAADAADADATVTGAPAAIAAPAAPAAAAIAAPAAPAAAAADLADALWETCRSQARPRLEDLARRVTSSAGWDDLVLPEAALAQLREVAAHVRHRTTVYDRWGFGEGPARGLGISALFAGASGTGKTLAAEVLAHELRLDLFHIDLSAVVSKYIGETEKNLARVFTAAEEGGAILLFDEADALFGKRSEVKDSHDRHANIEVSYLLQRMESYRGLAILTTNLRDALDGAFLRRLRFSIEFPFPDAAQRTAIWSRVFPAATPTADLAPEKLARLSLAGGSIRNIAQNAAFLAAAAGTPVGMDHLLVAVRSEYTKLGKPLPETEVRGW